MEDEEEEESVRSRVTAFLKFVLALIFFVACGAGAQSNVGMVPLFWVLFLWMRIV